MALLNRVRGKGPLLDYDDGRMSVIEHLEALRRALIISVVAWIVATVLAFFISNQVLELLIHRAGLKELVFLAPTGGFVIRLKIALYVGIVIASPIVFWQIWWFVSPGLHVNEKKLALPAIIATTFFFLLGVSFSIFSLPLIIRVLTGFAPPDFHFFPEGDAFLGFVLALAIAYGLVFELPVVIYGLGRIGIIKTRWLYKNRAYWYVALGLVANILTPGADPLTPLLMAVPLWVFWEGSALLLKLSGK